ncbi:MAG: preprotein translocase subunit YajC [Elusimicrobia bacterium]|nr:preprotein translocase subunit YajC [Elusimicrobiota bacterium]
MISLAYANAPSGPQANPPSPMVSLMPLFIIFIIFYFLLIRPQQKKMKQHKKMLESLTKGDKILTSSGFYAIVVSVGEKSVEIKLAENLKVKILKSAVSEIIRNGSGEIVSTSIKQEEIKE